MATEVGERSVQLASNRLVLSACERALKSRRTSTHRTQHSMTSMDVLHKCEKLLEKRSEQEFKFGFVFVFESLSVSVCLCVCVSVSVHLCVWRLKLTLVFNIFGN